MTLFEDLDRRLLPGFRRQSVDTGEGPVQTLIAGDGPPVLMLHGDPQTHLCWHGIAPELARSRTVVLTDLRGRGESHKPGPTEDHAPYTKRAMAAEQVAVMEHFGFSTFAVVGHDRGARVARRMALDHPDIVERLVVMDIVPAIDFYEQTNAAIAQDYYYFFFLTQPRPIAERLIAGDPERFMGQILTGLPGATAPYDPDAFALYLKASGTAEAITAMCECFRAGRTRDIEIDRMDRRHGNTIECPTLVMWGANGVMGQYFDIRAIWTSWAPAARFRAMDCGHFIPEEAARETTEILKDFLA
ncbi:MAG: alpha/beta hydrolase [Pseudomonadota bacterium]